MRAADKLIKSVYAHLAVRIRSEREKQGLSMLSVAETAGVSQQMVSYLERGMRNPSLDVLIRVTTVLNLDLPNILSEALPKKSD